jgi:acetyltransferase-like isoleucine patch superfamily enzyme
MTPQNREAQAENVGYGQDWNLKKIVCYLCYVLIAKHLPSKDQLGFVGRFAAWLRTIVVRPLLLESAKVISVGKGVDFDNGGNLVMKDHANIGDDALFSGNAARIIIGRHVMMGKQCIIICQNHRYMDGEKYEGFEGKDVVIDDFAWIGHRVTILPGVTIGKHAIVGAGAVVTKNVPDYAIAVGNPAAVKKYRGQEDPKSQNDPNKPSIEK